MKIKCQYMELGKSLFLIGTSYGEKLYPKSGKGNLEIFWDEENRRAEIHSIKGFTYITEPWVFTYEPEQGNKVTAAPKHHKVQAGVAAKAQIGGPNDVRTAQVSTPMDKVQGKPGRKPKFQGEETQGE